MPYQLDPRMIGAIALFDLSPGKEVAVDDIYGALKTTGTSRREVIRTLKKMALNGVFRFVSGRRGGQSRIQCNEQTRLLLAARTSPSALTNGKESRAEDPGPTLTVYPFPIRSGLVVNIPIPNPFTSLEASRMADFIRSLGTDD